ncbi:ribosomal protein L22 [Patellaria atrata CBS 101060]|uniref:Ribosomal protein L22 n=1 Tax=Patellaria atrata CBS 101060 TaxID=1346257 RepID=A0A9P4VSP2_9PEZI|nr:ribosomal protein L22 [Patellaria atrata CBS 101060]
MPRRGIRWWGRGSSTTEQTQSENPILDEYLAKQRAREDKRKKASPAPSPMSTGDLSADSIFADEHDTGKAAQPAEVPEPTGPRPRDKAAMAAALDPDPRSRRRWERKMVIREIRKRGRLSKAQVIKRTERESLTKSPFIHTSIKKLGPLARQIAGKPIEEAITQMRFSKKKAAIDVKQILEHARNEAIVRRGMGLGKAQGEFHEPLLIRNKEGKKMIVTDKSRIYVDQAWVGRGSYTKEPSFRARGRVDILRSPQTSISVLLKEEKTRIREHEERKKKRDNRKLWVQLPDRPIQQQTQWYKW